MADYRVPSPLAREAMAYVLAGGRGTRLMELTDRRAKPAVYFGGKARIIDVTLAYQASKRSILWSWLCGQQSSMAIHVDTLPIPVDMLAGDYEADAEFRARFQHWVNGIWSRKDARLERMQHNAGQTQASPRLT